MRNPQYLLDTWLKSKGLEEPSNYPAYPTATITIPKPFTSNQYLFSVLNRIFDGCNSITIPDGREIDTGFSTSQTPFKHLPYRLKTNSGGDLVVDFCDSAFDNCDPIIIEAGSIFQLGSTESQYVEDLNRVQTFCANYKMDLNTTYYQYLGEEFGPSGFGEWLFLKGLVSKTNLPLYAICDGNLK